MAAVADQTLNESCFNASTVSDEARLESILCECAKFYAFPDRFRTLTVTIFDRQNGQFLLMDEGWEELQAHSPRLGACRAAGRQVLDTEGRHGRRDCGGFDERGRSEKADCAGLSAPRSPSVQRISARLIFRKITQNGTGSCGGAVGRYCGVSPLVCGDAGGGGAVSGRDLGVPESWDRERLRW